MTITLPLKRMSKADKLRTMEAIWVDLTVDDRDFKSPGWHAAALAETEQLVKQGKARFLDWEDAKEMIRRKAR